MHIVYRHLDKNGTLLYVGCSSEINSRTAQHQYSSKWFKDIATIHLQHFQSREDALAMERRLILTLKPIYNVRFNKHGPRSKFMKYLKFLERCEARNQKIYLLRDKGMSLGDIGKKHRMTRQRVHQIIANRPRGRRNGA